MDRIWIKTRAQAEKINIIIMASLLVVVLVGLVWILGGIQERSLAVVMIGMGFLGFAAIQFYTY
jgi:hypothetical protein